MRLCEIDDLDAGAGHQVTVEGRRLAVFLVDGAVRVIDNACLHAGGPLADGAVVDGCVICPFHGWVYELASGRCVVGARTAGDVRAYDAWVDDGVVVAELD